MAKNKPTRAPTYSIPFASHARPEGVDDRALLPLDYARAIVAGATTFARDGQPPADRLWAALLSLEDGAEFSREAARLDWQFPFLRGWDNEDAVLRYGVGALAWLEALLDQTEGFVGAVPASPFYFVGTHLLAIGPAAAKTVLRVRRDADADPDGLGFVSDWLARQDAPAWVALGELALSGDASAQRALHALARRSPSKARRHLGKELASRVLGAPASLEAKAILAVLDAAASAPIGERLPWPTLVASAGHFEYHAMRVVAARAKRSDDWGLLIEVVQGDQLGAEDAVRWPATIQCYTYGSKVASGGRYLLDARPIPKAVAKERIDAERVAELDLRPGRSITGPLESWPDVLRLRAAVASAPEALFPPAAEVVGRLGLRAGDVLLDVRALEHVDGTAHGKGELARLPSQSGSWRSIAEVIATRDPSRFLPGSPNTDWRLHAELVTTGVL